MTENLVIKLSDIREMDKEIQETSVEAFLVKRKAIKVVNGSWHVMQYEGLAVSGEEPYPGYKFRNDIPYTFWSEVVGIVMAYSRKKEKDEKAQNESLEQLAEEFHGK